VRSAELVQALDQPLQHLLRQLILEQEVEAAAVHSLVVEETRVQPEEQAVPVILN
jgi:hypothetical protein